MKKIGALIIAIVVVCFLISLFCDFNFFDEEDSTEEAQRHNAFYSSATENFETDNEENSTIGSVIDLPSVSNNINTDELKEKKESSHKYTKRERPILKIVLEEFNIKKTLSGCGPFIWG